MSRQKNNTTPRLSTIITTILIIITISQAITLYIVSNELATSREILAAQTEVLTQQKQLIANVTNRIVQYIHFFQPVIENDSWVDINLSDFISERFYYKNGGDGGFDGVYCYATLNGTRDTGQWTHSQTTADYGIYRWMGRHIVNQNKAGWTLQGLVSRNAANYIAFEAWLRFSVFRCITYHNNRCTYTIVDFDMNDSDEHVFQITWLPGETWFFIDEKLVAYHITHVPPSSTGLYFHTQVGLPDWLGDIDSFLRSDIRNVQYQGNVTQTN